MKILIIEDEHIVAQRLIRLLEKILNQKDHAIRHLEDLFEGLAYVREHTIDLLFLDLNLSGSDGFRILIEAAAGSFQTVIVSAHAEQAIRAFEYGVTDFISKPYTEERLRLALKRVMDRDPGRKKQVKYLAVREGKELRTILISDIIRIRGADDYSEIYCNDGSSHLHHKTLRDLCSLLPPDFERIHRSYVANLQYLRGLETQGNQPRLILSNGERLPVSRRKISGLRKRLG